MQCLIHSRVPKIRRDLNTIRQRLNRHSEDAIAEDNNNINNIVGTSNNITTNNNSGRNPRSRFEVGEDLSVSSSLSWPPPPPPHTFQSSFSSNSSSAFVASGGRFGRGGAISDLGVASTAFKFGQAVAGGIDVSTCGAAVAAAATAATVVVGNGLTKTQTADSAGIACNKRRRRRIPARASLKDRKGHQRDDVNVDCNSLYIGHQNGDFNDNDDNNNIGEDNEDEDICASVRLSDYERDDKLWQGPLRGKQRNTTNTNTICCSCFQNNKNNNNTSLSDQQSSEGSMSGITRFVLEGSKLETPQSRTDLEHVKRPLDNLEYEPNPDVAPYQPANFMSSTILKKVPIPKRHLDTFGGYEYNFMGKRGVMLHTDRYQVDFIKSFDGMTQRERLQAGLNYVEAMRGTKRRREMIPHRAQLDLMMGGKQIEFEERFYLSRELQKLKALAMPQNAKDLFHGRGIQLPSHHMSIRPRYRMPNDMEDEVMASAPSSLQSVPIKNDSLHQHCVPVPSLDRDLSFVVGRGGHLRSRSTINRHNQLPSIRGGLDSDWGFPLTGRRAAPRGRLHRDVTSLSRSHTIAPPPSRDFPDGHQRMLARGKSESMAPKKPIAPVDVSGRDIHRVPEVDSATGDSIQGTARTEPETMPTQSDQGPGSVGRGPESIHDKVPPPESRESKVRPMTEEGQHSTTPNPLKATDFITSVPQDEQEELRQTFQRLDTDMDGHIKYNQLKTQLPKHFSNEQERFIEEVYNLTNSITFFGVDEFMAMDRLYKTVEALTGRAEDAYQSLNFGSLQQDLLKYVALFDEADSGNRGSLSLEQLQKILSSTISSVLTSDSSLWDEVLDMISTEYASKISKINFIAHMPLFQSLEKDYK